MRQRLALIGFSYFGATVAAVYFSTDLSLMLGQLFCALFILSILIPKLRRTRTVPIFLCCICVAMTVYSYKYEAELLPLQALDEKSVNITAQVVDIPYDTASGTVYTLRVLSHDAPSEISNFKIRVTKRYAEDVLPYDTVTCKVKLYSLHNRGAASEAYFASRGISFTGYVEAFYNSFRFYDDEKPLNYYILKLRQYIENAFNSSMKYSSARIARAMLIGEKAILDPELYNRLSVVGSSHIIVVSGLHLSVISCFVFLIFNKLFKNKKLISIISIAFVVVFMTVTGFTPSVCRAGTVCIVSLIGQMFSVKQHRYAGIGLAAFLITVINPFAAGDIGMQFSFATSLGIMLFASPIEKYICNKLSIGNGFIGKLLRVIVGSVSVSVSATLMSLPVFVFHLKTFSVYFVLANLILVPMSELLLVLFLLTAALFYIPIIGFTSQLFAFAADYLCELLRRIAELISGFPYACVNISYKFIAVWLAFTLILVAMNILWRRKYAFVGKSILSSLIILITGICTSFVINADTVTLKTTESAAVLNYNGNSAVILYTEDLNVAENEIEYITANSNNISLVLVAASNNDCKSAAVQLINSYGAQNVIMREEDTFEIKSVINDKTVKLLAAETKTDFVLWGKLKLRPVVCGDNICMFVTCKEKTILIIPANTDISELDEGLLNVSICILGEGVTGLERLSSNVVLFNGSSEADGNAAESINCDYIIPIKENAPTVLEPADGNKVFIRGDLMWQN